MTVQNFPLLWTAQICDLLLAGPYIYAYSSSVQGESRKRKCKESAHHMKGFHGWCLDLCAVEWQRHRRILLPLLQEHQCLVRLYMDLGNSGIFCHSFSLWALCVQSVSGILSFLIAYLWFFFKPTSVCRVLCFSANTEVLRTEEEYSFQECFQAGIPCNSLCSWAFPEVLQEAERDKHLLIVFLDCCSTFIIPWKVCYLLVFQCCHSSSVGL